ncbi:MAG: TetR/AcrR family transcriptional regulator [Myxococcota bacterium]
MKKKPRLTAADRRAQLMQVGREVFAEHGYDSTLIDDIAQRAGVSKPIVYEHFGSKEGLYAAIVDKELDTLTTRVSDSISKGTPRKRFENAVHAFMTYTLEEPAGFAVLARDAPTSLGRRGLTRVIDDVALRVSDLFRVEFARAGFDPAISPIYAHALTGMVTQVGQWWALEGREIPVEFVVQHVSALGWMGLRHLPKIRPLKARKKERA